MPLPLLTKRDSGKLGANADVRLELWLLFALATLLLLVPSSAAQTWTQVWSDEFNGPANSAPDPANWNYDTGGGGWGNNELEIYCAPGSNASPCSASNPNIYQDGNGNLVIQAIKTQSGTWTSGRMKTEGLQPFQYGRIEARMKLPGNQHRHRQLADLRRAGHHGVGSQVHANYDFIHDSRAGLFRREWDREQVCFSK